MAARKRTSLPTISRTPPSEQLSQTAKERQDAQPPKALRHQITELQAELRRKSETLQRSEEHFRLLYEYAPLGYQSLDADGRFLDVNPAWLKLLGYEREDVIGKWFGDFLTPACRQVFVDNFPSVKAAEELHGVEFDMIRKDGASTCVSFDSRIAHDEEGNFLQTHCILQDVTARKRAETYRNATVDLLRLCQTGESLPDLVRHLTGCFQQLTGCEAVGVRLRDGPDYPYYESRGFPPDFLLAENRLCAVDEAGELVRDSAGSPVIECMCGNILCGRVDRSKPFFTTHGSFWTNCTTDLLAGTTEADRQGRTRNRCNGEGYESVALLPLRAGGEIFGLLQLNDKRKGMFSAERIAELESLVDYLAIAVSRRLATDSLQKSRTEYRRIVETANEGIWVIDADRRTTYANRQMAEILGCRESDLIGTRLTDWVAAEDLPANEERMKARARGNDEKYEQRWRRADGTSIWCSVSATVVRDEAGRFAGSFAMITDITERKQAEEEIAALAARNDVLLQTASDGIHVLDEKGNVVAVNEAFCRLLGYTQEELMRLNVADWDTQWAPEELKEMIRREMVSPAMSETRHRRKDGEIRIVEVSTRGVTLENRTYLYASARDITDHKKADEALRKSEEQLALAIDGSGVGLWDWTILTGEVKYNDRWAEILGYDRDELSPMTIETWNKLAHPDDLSRSLEMLQRHFAGQTPMYECELRMRHKHGHWVWILDRAKVTHWDNQHRPLRMAGTHLDITERKKADEQLQSASLYARSLLEASLDALVTISLEGKITDVNRATESATGVPRERLIGSDFSNYFVEPEKARAGYQQVFSQGLVRDFPLTIRHSSGKTADVLYNATVYQNQAGEIQGVFAAARDITDRKLAVEALRRSEQFARSTLDSLSAHIAIVNQDGMIEAVNWAWREFAAANGIDPDRVCEGSDYLGLCEKASGDHSEGAAEFAEAVRDVLAGFRSYFQTEYPCHSPERQRWFTARVTRFPEEGLPRVVIAHEDITERKQATDALRESETRYRELYARMGSGVAVYQANKDGTDFIFTDINLAGQRLSRVSREDVVGRSVLDVFPGVKDLGLYDVLQRVWRTGTPEHCPLAHYKDARISQWVENAVYKLPSGEIVTVYDDISERKRAEDALRESEARLQMAQKMAGLGYWSYNIQTKMPTWSEEMFHIFGCDPAKGVPNYDGHRTFIHPDNWEMFDTAVQGAIQGTGYDLVLRVVFPDESIHFVHTQGYPQYDSQGRLLGLFGTSQDITQRTLAETALRQSEERFRNIFEHSPLGIAIARLEDQHILQANQQMSELLGYSQEELTRLTIRDITHPDDMAAQTAEMEDMLAGRRTKSSREKRYIRKDGTIRWVHLTSTLLAGPPDRTLIRLGVVEDITEQKAAEKERTRLVTAIEQVAEAVVITDAQGVIQYVNPAFEDMTGYSPVEAFGETPRLLNSGRQSREFYQELWDTIKSGNTWNGRFTNRRKDGTLYEEEATISPIIDQAGNIVNFVGVKRDVTLEAVLADQLRQSQKMEAIGQLAAGVAHDFDNLLTAIYGYVELAKRVIPPEHAVFESLCGIESVAKQGNAVTRGLLTFSGRLATEKTDVELGGVLREVIQLLRRLLPASIELDADVPADPPVWVHADATQLHQVVINLAINARDAMTDSGRLTIAMRSEGNGRTGEDLLPNGRPDLTAMIEVRDTGAGMTPEVQAHIFEPFFTTKPHGRGTGLGLAIVRGIVEEHAGRLEVKSSPGAGSTFRLFLPCTVPPTTGVASASAVSKAHGHGEPVLLAEDDQYVRGVIVTTLQHNGYRVIAAAGDELPALYEEHRGQLSLLMLDVDLPGCSGLDVLSRIRAGGDQVPAMLITAHAAVPPEALGANDVLLHKPFHLRDLTRIAAQMIRDNLPKDCIS